MSQITIIPGTAPATPASGQLTIYAKADKGVYAKDDTGLETELSNVGVGTVTSVGLSDGSSSPIYTISGSPVTTSGTLTFSLSTQTANKIFVGPSSGGAAQPTFRTMVTADLDTAIVTNAKLATMADKTIKANISGGSASPTDVGLVSINTASTAVFRDVSGNFAAGTITASLTGSASGNLSYTPNQYGVLTSGSGNTVTVIAPDASTTKVLKSGGASADPSWLAYASANTASNLVFRDGSGNFSAGTITATLTGTASGNTTYSANNHGVVLSSATNSMTVIAPDASTAKFLKSAGASADPSWAQVTLTTDVTGTLPLLNGGTGTAAASANAAFNALSPLTTKGDVLGFSTVNARLGVGSDGQVLTADAASTLGFKWAAASGGVTTVGTIDSQSKSANGLVISGTSIYAQSADATNPGLVTTGTQTMAGAKTFTGNTLIAQAAGSIATIGLSGSTAKHIINGGQVGTTRTITGNLTVDTTTTDFIIFATTSSGAISITLPAPSNGRVLYIKDISGSANTNNITIIRNGSEKIEGVAASKLLTTNWGSWNITSDGTDWFFI